MVNFQHTFKHKPFLLPYYLEPHLTAFIEQLRERGFTQFTLRGYYDSVSHFGSWLNKKSISLSQVNLELVNRFAKHRCYCPGHRRTHSISRKYAERVRKFVIYLHRKNIINDVSFNLDGSHYKYLSGFRVYLNQRGLSPTTINNYEDRVSKILPILGDDSEIYTAKAIKKCVHDIAKNHSVATTKNRITALRAYLKYLATQALCQPELVCAVPVVPQWRLSSIPKYITAEKVERVINVCNGRKTKEIRDKAVILLLARLALRASDIVHMQLFDINWRKGVVRVRGKQKCEDLLPLPQDAGDALLDYIENARPPVAIESVFLCLNAPYRPFATSGTVSGIVSEALARANISDPPSRGAHLLRHSAATNILRLGVSLETVSAILRHHSLDMTAYYAKVDIPLLQQIAQPWPEVDHVK